MTDRVDLTNLKKVDLLKEAQKLQEMTTKLEKENSALKEKLEKLEKQLEEAKSIAPELNLIVDGEFVDERDLDNKVTYRFAHGCLKFYYHGIEYKSEDALNNQELMHKLIDIESNTIVKQPN